MPFNDAWSNDREVAKVWANTELSRIQADLAPLYQELLNNPPDYVIYCQICQELPEDCECTDDLEDDEFIGFVIL